MSGKRNPKKRRTPAKIDEVVWSILAESESPIGAYDIVRQTDERGNSMVPAQVYRCLDRLMNQGSVLKIASRKHYYLTTITNPLHLLCTQCGSHGAVDLGMIPSKIATLCDLASFHLRCMHLEASGLCRHCNSGHS